MHKFANNVEADDNVIPLDLHEIPKNLRARAWHMADDPEGQKILDGIFGGVKKIACRTELDNKSSRAVNQW